MGNLSEPVLALIDHGSEVNIMSKSMYDKGKWPIDVNPGWRIKGITNAPGLLYGACPDVPITIGDITEDLHFLSKRLAYILYYLGNLI